MRNIENGKLHRQVASAEAGLNQESKSHVFILSAVTLLHTWKFPRKNHSCWEWLNFYYCYQVYNNRRRYRRRPAMTDDQLTADNRRRLFGVYSWPAAGDICAHTTPNGVKLLPIYERYIGQAAASPISRPSSPLSAVNAYKSSSPRL